VRKILDTTFHRYKFKNLLVSVAGYCAFFAELSNSLQYDFIEKHREYTGTDNTLILSNIRKTVDMKKPLIIRISVIPGHNDDVENIDETARFIAETLNNAVLQVQLLPYRPLGLEKYDSLNIPYPLVALKPDVKEQKNHLDRLVNLMKKHGIPAVAGSSEKIS
jgi:pyruvate formate lyase activating enzyme